MLSGKSKGRLHGVSHVLPKVTYGRVGGTEVSWALAVQNPPFSHHNHLWYIDRMTSRPRAESQDVEHSAGMQNRCADV